VFWADSCSNRIMGAPKAGGTSVTMAQTNEQVFDIAVDSSAAYHPDSDKLFQDDVLSRSLGAKAS
jgi:hypothetical protein